MKTLLRWNVKCISALLLFFTSSLFSFSQLNYSQNWNTNQTLQSWTSSGASPSVTGTQACDGNSVRANLYGTGINATWTFTSPNLGNVQGASIKVEFDYKIVNWSAATVPTPANFGSIQMQWASSLTGPWNNAGIIDASNHIPTSSCSTVAFFFTPPAGALYVRFLNTRLNGDYYIYFDDFSATEGSFCVAPLIDSVVVNAINNVQVYYATSSSNNTLIARYGQQGFNIQMGSQVIGNTATNPLVLSTGFLPGLAYEIYLQELCGSDSSSLSQVYIIPASFFGGGNTSSGVYCNAGPTSTADSEIRSVILNGSGASINNVISCPASGTGVKDFTSQVAIVNPGQAYSLEVQFGTCGGNYNNAAEAWVDWNQNEIFESSESIGSWTGMVPSTQNFGFTVPGSSSSGLYRMRVMQREAGSLPLNPCGTYTWGAVHDYSLEILGNQPTCLPPSTISLQNNNFSSIQVFVQDTLNTAATYNVYYGLQGAAIGAMNSITNVANNSSAILSGLQANSNYQVYVQTNCGAGDLSNVSGPWNFNTILGADCNSALPFFSLPYTDANRTTQGAGNYITNGAGNVCNNFNLSGEDFLYTYTPTVNQVAQVIFTNTSPSVSFIITEGCPNAVGSICVATGGGNMTNPQLNQITFEANKTYYITVDNPSSLSANLPTTFTMNISLLPPDLELLSAYEISQCQSGSDTLMLKVKNVRNDIIDFSQNPFSISYKIDGVISDSSTLLVNNGVLVPGDTLLLPFYPIDFSNYGVYNLNAFINSSWDTNFNNDSLQTSFDISESLLLVPDSMQVISLPSDTVVFLAQINPMAIPGSFTSISNPVNASLYCSSGPSSAVDTELQGVQLQGALSSIQYSANCPTTSGYKDLTSLVAGVVAGQSYNLSVSWGSCGGNFNNVGSAWIDWNRDGIFSPSELIGSKSTGNVAITQDFNFSVPSSAVAGQTRMRVIQRESGTLLLNPCQNFTYGTVADFTIDVLSFSTSAFSWTTDTGFISSNPRLELSNLPGNGIYTYVANLQTNCGLVQDTVQLRVDIISDDVGVSQIISPKDACNIDSMDVIVEVCNYSAYFEYGIPVNVEVDANTLTIVVDSLAPFTCVEVDLGKIYIPNLPYTINSVQAYTSLNGDTDLGNDTTFSSNIEILGPPAPPIGIADTVCVSNTSAMLRASSSEKVFWYDSIQGGNLLAIGDTFFTPSINNSTNFYAQSGGVADVQIQPGSGTTSNTTTTYPAPFGSFYRGARGQYLYLASELQAAGMVAGDISALSLKVTALNNAMALSDFNLKIGLTNATDLSSWLSGLTVFYSDSSYMPVLGDNVFEGIQAFYWDGISNILIETCFRNTAFGQNASTEWTTNLPFIASRTYRSDSDLQVCSSNSTSALNPNNRPNFAFEVKVGSECVNLQRTAVQAFFNGIDTSATTLNQPSDCFTSDGSILLNASYNSNAAQLGTLQFSIDGGANYQTTSLFSGLTQATLPYELVVSDGVCTIDLGSVNLDLPNQPNPPLSVSNLSFCESVGSDYLRAIADSSGVINWYSDVNLSQFEGNDSILPPSNTGSYVYYVTQTIAGCESVGLKIEVEVYPISPAPNLINDTSICIGQAFSIKEKNSNQIHPFFSELIHFKSTTSGTPISGWPSWMIADDNIEVSTLPNASLAGYVIEVWVSAASSPERTFTFPIAASSNAEGTVMLGWGSGVDDLSNTYYRGGYSANSYQSTTSRGYVLKSPLGEIVDVAVYFGSTAFNFSMQSGVDSLHWSGNDLNSGSGTSGFRRVNAKDNNSSSDWVLANNSNPQDPNVLNTNFAIAGALNFYDNISGTLLHQGSEFEVSDSSSFTTYFANKIDSNLCPSAFDSVRISRLPAGNALQILGARDYCLGEFIAPLQASGNIGQVYWYSDSALTQLLDSGNTFQPTLSVNDTLILYAKESTIGLCETAITTVVLRMFPSPLIDSVLVTDVSGNCVNNNGSIEVFTSNISVSNSSFFLYKNNDTIIQNNGLFDSLSLGNYSVGITLGSCSTIAPAIAIDAPGQPFLPILISTDTFYCENEQVVSLQAQINSFDTSSINQGAQLNWFSNAQLTNLIDSGSAINPSQNFGQSTYYVLVNNQGCKGPAASVTVNRIQNPQAPNLPANFSYCIGDTLPPIFASSQLGTTISWYSDTLFNNLLQQNSSSFTIPQVLGKQQFVAVSLSVEGCAGGFSAIEVEGNPLPLVNLSLLGTACFGFDTIVLSGGMPSGGFYSGQQVFSGSSFIPAIIGANTVSYTYQDSNLCENTSSTQIEVFAPTQISIDSISDICREDTSLLLQALPLNGNFLGNGVSGNIFNPLNISGNFTFVTYIYTDSNNCISKDSVEIKLLPLPSFTLGADRVMCFGDTLQITAAPSNYNYLWSNGATTQSTSINLNQSEYISLEITDSNSCTFSDSLFVLVNDLPVISFDDISVCEDTGSFLMQSAQPFGGFYSGQFVSGFNTFNTNLSGSGNFSVTYTYIDSNSCVGNLNAEIRVNQIPSVTLGAFPDLCFGDEVFTLTQGAPIGGAYSGIGVSQNSFTPDSVGVFTISYVYADSNKCKSSVSQLISVLDLPVVNFDTNFVACENSGEFSLFGGFPIGGTYSGPYVGGGLFSPGQVGLHTIYYEYVDLLSGCSNSDSTIVEVASLPVVNIVNENSGDPNASQITLNAGGGFALYLWNTGANTQSILVNPNQLLPSYTVTVIDSNGCEGQQTIFDVWDPSSVYDELENHPKYKVFPNPSNGIFYLQFEDMNWGFDEGILYNSLGNTILNFSKESQLNSEFFKIDLTNYPSGLYFLKLQTEKEPLILKLLLR